MPIAILALQHPRRIQLILTSSKPDNRARIRDLRQSHRNMIQRPQKTRCSSDGFPWLALFRFHDGDLVMEPDDVRFIGIDHIPRTRIMLITIDDPEQTTPDGIKFR